VWTAIIYILTALFLAVLCFALLAKKECFTVVLKSGAHYEGFIRYRGKRDPEALKAEIIEKVQDEFPDDEVAQVYIG